MAQGEHGGAVWGDAGKSSDATCGVSAEPCFADNLNAEIQHDFPNEERPMLNSLSPLSTVTLAALLNIGASAQAAEYNIEPILSPSGGRVFPSSIAANGMVAGRVDAATSSCFKYLNGVFTTLPLPPQSLRCEGAVTDLQGNITMTVVPSDNPNTIRLVELSMKGKFRPLTGLRAEGNTVAASNSGRMAGQSPSPSGEPQAYLFSRAGAGVNVGALTGMTRSWLTGLNAKGWAVGYAQNAGSSRYQAFRYRSGKITWLGSLTEGGATLAAGINATGTMVGSSETVVGDFMSFRAVTWQSTAAPINLGTLFGTFTNGAAINSQGVVIGTFGLGVAAMRVRDGIASDLYSLILPEQRPQWGMLGVPVAINDNGLIAGGLSSFNGNFNAGYLLRPIN